MRRVVGLCLITGAWHPDGTSALVPYDLLEDDLSGIRLVPLPDALLDEPVASRPERPIPADTLLWLRWPGDARGIGPSSSAVPPYHLEAAAPDGSPLGSIRDRVFDMQSLGRGRYLLSSTARRERAGPLHLTQSLRSLSTGEVRTLSECTVLADTPEPGEWGDVLSAEVLPDGRSIAAITTSTDRLALSVYRPDRHDAWREVPIATRTQWVTKTTIHGSPRGDWIAIDLIGVRPATMTEHDREVFLAKDPWDEAVEPLRGCHSPVFAPLGDLVFALRSTRGGDELVQIVLADLRLEVILAASGVPRSGLQWSEPGAELCYQVGVPLWAPGRIDAFDLKSKLSRIVHQTREPVIEFERHPRQPWLALFLGDPLMAGSSSSQADRSWVGTVKIRELRAGADILVSKAVPIGGLLYSQAWCLERGDPDALPLPRSLAWVGGD